MGTEEEREHTHTHTLSLNSLRCTLTQRCSQTHLLSEPLSHSHMYHAHNVTLHSPVTTPYIQPYVWFHAQTQPVSPCSHIFTQGFIYNHFAHTSYAHSYTLMRPNTHIQIHSHLCSLHSSHSHLGALMHSTHLRSYSSPHSHTYSHAHALTRQPPERNRVLKNRP